MTNTPVPRPPAGLTPHTGPVFDAVTAVSPTDAAWMVRDVTTGQRRLSVNARVNDQKTPLKLLERVVSWADRRRRDAEQVTLRLHSMELREAAVANLDPARFTVVDPLDLLPAAAWAEQARAELRSALDERLAERTSKRVLYAASDGSVHPVYGNGAFAWVTTSGVWYSERSRFDIQHTELSAILSFAQFFDNCDTHGKAVLFVDSLNAVQLILERSPALGLRRDQGRVRTLLHLVDTGRLELVWVRSHAGHPLNELADRLALSRYRAVSAGLSNTHAQMAGQMIVDGAAEVLAGTDWAAVAADSRAAWAAHRASHELMLVA